MDNKNLSVSSLLSKPRELKNCSSLCSSWPIIDERDVASVTSYLSRGQPLSIAKNEGVVKKLEEEFNKKLRLNRIHTLSFNSGTNALYAAFRACMLRPRMDVIAAGYTFHATVTPAIAQGAKVHLIDSDPLSGNVTSNIVEEAIKKIPKARILVVNHNWGIPIEDIASIVRLAHSRDITVIEDCSHAHGATIDGQPVGSFGDISVFSLQASKLVVAGEGGIALTDDPKLYVSMKAQGHYRRIEAQFLQNTETAEIERYMETGVGGVRFRIASLSAVLALSQLKKFQRVLEARRLYAGLLQEAVQNIKWLRFPLYDVKRSKPSWYNIRLKYLPKENNNIPVEAVIKKMQGKGLEVHLGTSVPLTEFLIFQKNYPHYPFEGSDRPLHEAGDLPNASLFCKDTIVFPVFSKNDTLTRNVIQAYIYIINNLY